jgi:hypothetical protein
LLDAFLPAAYRGPVRWTASEAEPWLVFLARHLEYEVGGADFAWWEMGSLMMAHLKPRLPARRVLFRPRLLAMPLLVVLAFFVVLDLLLPGRPVSAPVTLCCALYCGLAFGVPRSFLIDRCNLTHRVSPGSVLRHDRQVALTIALGIALPAGLLLSFAVPFSGGLPRLLYSTVGIFSIGAEISAKMTAWPSYLIRRSCLALRRQLPWALMSFLEDAHRRGVVRQVGAVYQFRHIELQRCLATRGGPPPGGADREGAIWAISQLPFG